MNLFDKSKSIICFVRHGQTDWNTKGLMQGREEIPLNENGIKQAEWAAHFFRMAKEKYGVRWDKVVSSPLSRAEKTARIIANGAKCDNFYTDKRLIERDFGALSGLHYDAYSKAISENVEGVSSIETVECLLSRVNDFIKSNVRLGDRVILVTHGAVGRIYALNSEKASDIKKEDIRMFSNCHMALYSYDGEKTLLECYNASPERLCDPDFIGLEEK